MMKFRRNLSLWIAVAVVLTMFATEDGIAFSQQVPASGDKVELSLSEPGSHDVTIQDIGVGFYEIKANGPQPMVVVTIHGAVSPLRTHVLAFEYFSPTSTDHVRVRYGTSEESLQTYTIGGLSHSEGFTNYSADLAAAPNWDKGIRVLRLGFDLKQGQIVQIRNLSLRAPTPDEEQAAKRRVQEHEYGARLNTDLETYLSKTYPATVTSVYVGKKRVHIEGNIGNISGAVYLAEVPLNEDITEIKSFDYVVRVQVKSGHFQINLTRFRNLPDHQYDRVFSKWALVQRNGAGYKLLSHARYADGVVSRWDIPDAIPATKKDLVVSAWADLWPTSMISEFEASRLIFTWNFCAVLRGQAG